MKTKRCSFSDVLQCKFLLCLTLGKKRKQHELTLLDHFGAKIPNTHDDVPTEPSKIRNSVADTAHVAHAHADQNNLKTASLNVKLDVNNTSIEPMIFDIESDVGNFYQNSAILSDEQNFRGSQSQCTKIGYISFENDTVITICDEVILQKITSEIKEAKFFTILNDEAVDVSNVKQMPIVLRYVDRESQIRDSFVGFFPCNEGITGEAISNKILDGIAKLSLDMNVC
eukprot:gene10544-11661_t